MTETRQQFLKKAVGGAVGVATAGGLSGSARASGRSAELDATFISPYLPNPVFSYPSEWFVYTALLPGVIEPYDVVFSNRQLGPLPDLDGVPDLGAAPSDATTLVVFSEQLPDDYDVSRAIPFVATMRFNDLGGGYTDRSPGNVRRFQGWWAARVNGSLYGFNVFVFVGPNAGSEWAEVQGIVDSIHLQ